MAPFDKAVVQRRQLTNLGGEAAPRTHCEYVHEHRLTRLSDHSVLTVRLTRTGTTPLLTSDPAVATSPTHPLLTGP